jgi:hypothetical protein
MPITAIEHVQLSMPSGMEAAARKFYEGVSGFPELPKQPHLAKYGGIRFERGALRCW